MYETKNETFYHLYQRYPYPFILQHNSTNIAYRVHFNGQLQSRDEAELSYQKATLTSPVISTGG
jgi:hypothetical protein